MVMMSEDRSQETGDRREKRGARREKTEGVRGKEKRGERVRGFTFGFELSAFIQKRS
jgi:hypothetical protein